VRRDISAIPPFFYLAPSSCEEKLFFTRIGISKPYAEIKMSGVRRIRFHRVYPGIMKNDMALNKPIDNPTKLVILSRKTLTLGYIKVETATMSVCLKL